MSTLLVGAEGTLSIVTEATSVAVVPFPIIHAAATALIRSGIQLAAIKTMDDQQITILDTHGSPTERKRHWAEHPTLPRFPCTAVSVQPDIAPHLPPTHPHHDHNDTPTHPTRTSNEEHDIWTARKEPPFHPGHPPSARPPNILVNQHSHAHLTGLARAHRRIIQGTTILLAGPLRRRATRK
ncbi:hypothetical protein N658DRAFT_71883 [Parathielavia hyrcaniae]|uniref:Uncharacterized protein n=1 Tax=Parathielavia hyrcaniae TaxID=113614 RepID=A0AAN6T272_9PEZI|nr:hypothetical protein N658DRAFT_71883 [Parathielavia hyrcaniae]